MTILNILQSIRKEAKKESPGAGNARYGRREVWTPFTHLPFTQLPPELLRFLSYFLFCAARAVLKKSRKCSRSGIACTGDSLLRKEEKV